MHPRLSPLAAALGLLFAAHAGAQSTELDPIKVTATRVAYPEADATYASEVHTRNMIDKSGAQSLFDYLAQHSSINIAPNFGNRFTPSMDMRGYGTEVGYQNIVVTLDGQRLNNIDMTPQLLGAIPLSAVDRIEITKGSGSVIHGDGAMAGTIQIHTRPYSGVSVGAYTGTQGALGLNAAAGVQGENYGVSVSADHAKHGGYSQADASGHRDASEMRNERASLKFRPVRDLWLNLDASSTRIDTRYANSLSQAQYNADPSLPGFGNYTHQLFATDQWRLGAEWSLSDATKLTVSHNREDKRSDYVGMFKADYDNEINDVALVHNGQSFDLTAGYQSQDGARIGAWDQTRKNSRAYYAQGAYRLGNTTLSAGLRRENVRYEYVPNGGSQLSRERDLDAWDLGINQRLNGLYSVFANLNQSFQAPDIDRFFVGGAFNAFIEPAKARTLTAGLNRMAPGNRFKLAVFRANLDNEIYYYNTGNWLTSFNTNIDKSHKYGVEVQQFWQATRQLSLNANYAYTRAFIDNENQGGGAFNGRELPGVPHHNLILSGSYALTERSELSLSQNWRSSSYAIGDFANNRSQRQSAYSLTNLAYRYRLNGWEMFATVQNLFDRKNGIWTANDSIYPMNFSRSALVGFKAKF
jgi:iron complex outermembrane receptor protein